MSAASGLDVHDKPRDRILHEFARLVPIARRGLAKMLVEDGSAFCFRSFPGEATDALTLEGRSERYTTMSLIGLLRQREHGSEPEFALAPLLDHVAPWGHDAPDLGDCGLVLWALLLAGDGRVESVVDRLIERKDEVFREDYSFASMEMGYLLMGLSKAIEADVGGPALVAFAAEVAHGLRANQDPYGELFSFGRKVWRKNMHRARMDARLGSFASQVYPTVGLAFHSLATGETDSRHAALRCAVRLDELQGPHGQWWWIYHTSRPASAIRYPVYSVHQDAMGPMALSAAALLDEGTDRFDGAIEKSLAWFNIRPELVGEELIDDERGVVWRAVQHDDPESTQRLGLGRSELQRMGWKAWFGTEDERSFAGGHLCLECRPYHLGWILLADAMYADVLRARGEG